MFGDIWERSGLSKRDRSLITVAMLTALYRHEQLPGHVGRALDNGVTKEELVEVITHATFYSGWPTGVQGGGHRQEGLRVSRPLDVARRLPRVLAAAAGWRWAKFRVRRCWVKAP